MFNMRGEKIIVISVPNTGLQFPDKIYDSCSLPIDTAPLKLSKNYCKRCPSSNTSRMALQKGARSISKERNKVIYEASRMGLKADIVANYFCMPKSTVYNILQRK